MSFLRGISVVSTRTKLLRLLGRESRVESRVRGGSEFITRCRQVSPSSIARRVAKKELIRIHPCMQSPTTQRPAPIQSFLLGSAVRPLFQGPASNVRGNGQSLPFPRKWLTIKQPRIENTKSMGPSAGNTSEFGLQITTLPGGGWTAAALFSPTPRLVRCWQPRIWDPGTAWLKPQAAR